MTISNKNIHWLFWLLLYGMLNTAHAAPIINQWETIKISYFNDKAVQDAQESILIEAPEQAEDAAMVPFAFKVNLKDGNISKVYLFTDANPILLTATFNFKMPQQSVDLATRIRLEKNSVVRVIVQTQDGRVLMKSAEIKTPGGGCGGGEMTDEAKLRASAGKMKMRWIKPEEKGSGSFVLNIKHPMRTGFERTFQGYFAKAWFIQNIDFLIDHKPYLEALLGPGISADPYFRFNLPEQKMGVLHVDAKDNEGQFFQQVFND
jgi:sulfur-oxidizing protein SoxY